MKRISQLVRQQPAQKSFNQMAHPNSKTIQCLQTYRLSKKLRINDHQHIPANFLSFFTPITTPKHNFFPRINSRFRLSRRLKSNVTHNFLQRLQTSSSQRLNSSLKPNLQLLVLLFIC